MPFQVLFDSFCKAEEASRKAEHTAKEHKAARDKNNLLAAEAHEALAKDYLAQNTDDWAGGSYLPHVTTRAMGKIYAKMHQAAADRHRKEVSPMKQFSRIRILSDDEKKILGVMLQNSVEETRISGGDAFEFVLEGDDKRVEKIEAFVKRLWEELELPEVETLFP